MARKTKKEKWQAEREATIEVTCDLCGRASPDPDNPEDNFWSDDHNSIARVVIKMDTGVWYDDNRIETVRFDICPECFKTKLALFIATEGGRLPTVTYS